jgi:hypothetical protein
MYALMLFSAWIFAIYPSVIQPLGFTVTPYSNSTQSGYSIVNISTYGKITLPIGNPNITLEQNYITPNESGVTLNGRAYYLTLRKPQRVYGQNGIYVELVKVLYIPSLHMVDFNLYQNASLQEQNLTSTSTMATTSSIYTTTVLPTTSTSTIERTTTSMPYNASSSSSNPVSNLIAQFLNFIRKILG